MERKAASGIMLTLLLIGILTLAINIQPVKAEETIYIRPDGTVYPSTAPINRVGDIYMFTANIYDSIVVERNNIVVDGSGYTLQGTGAYYSKGITLSGRSNVTIKNMKIKAFFYGIWLQWSSNNRIVGNNIANNRDGVWFEWSSNYNSISENDIANNVYGILFYYSSNYNCILRNNITTNTEVGIWLHSSSNFNNISENNITANNWIGVVFYSSSNFNSISENSIANNGYGIYLHSSSNNSISENNITNKGGISLYSSNFNSILGNNIATNKEYGIWLGMASNNKIYHNNFFNNTPQVKFYVSDANIWDDGYPSGGNYWSDYVERYPDAKELDDSGIWDRPYVIDAYNRDRYPLMNPWTPTPPLVTATIDIDPDTLNLRSVGNWITAYIQLPEGYSVADINATTIQLNGTIAPVLDLKYSFVTNSSEYLLDHNNDGVLERMIKFNRTLVSQFIISKGFWYGNVTLTITGQLYDGILLEGIDIILVRMPGDVNIDGKVDASDLFDLAKAYGSTPDRPNWNPNCDFNEDSKVDASDLYDLSRNYRKTGP